MTKRRRVSRPASGLSHSPARGPPSAKVLVMLCFMGCAVAVTVIQVWKEEFIFPTKKRMFSLKSFLSGGLGLVGLGGGGGHYRRGGGGLRRREGDNNNYLVMMPDYYKREK